VDSFTVHTSFDRSLQPWSVCAAFFVLNPFLHKKCYTTGNGTANKKYRILCSREDTMKRQVVLIMVLFAVVVASPLFAQFQGRSNRLGLAAGIPNGVLVYRPAPFDIKAGYDFTSGNQYVFLAGDVRLIDNRQMVGVLHGSFGIGAYTKLFPEGRKSDGDIEFDAGGRVPFALSILLLDNFLEFFVEIAPGIDFYPKPQFSNQPIQVFAGATFLLD
jgi:hypothetical protein